jgi:hypothetical protein
MYLIGKLISSVLPRGTVKGMLYEATFAATCVSSKTALCETKHVCSYMLVNTKIKSLKQTCSP